MIQDEVKQMITVYMMVNKELREGNFLQRQFHRVSVPREYSRERYGVVLGTHIDIVAELMEEDKFFIDDKPHAGSFKFQGRPYSQNASIESVEGTILDAAGTIVPTQNGGVKFKPCTFEKNPNLNDLRSKERFVRYASGIKTEAEGICIENGFLRVYGEHQRMEDTEMLRSYSVADIADRLFGVEE